MQRLFGTRRFDRALKEDGKERRIHVISAAGLLETSHRDLTLDYDILMKACLKLTGDFQEIEKLYRLMCFNVFAHNRDDHAKNFSFLYDEPEKRWKLSPAYDLTYSHSIGGRTRHQCTWKRQKSGSRGPAWRRVADRYGQKTGDTHSPKCAGMCQGIFKEISQLK